MKKEFSTHWKGSSQPRKQRKYVANAPISLKKKLMSAHLSKELRKKYGKRSLGIRKGDTVLVMRGKFKKKTGKIASVNVRKMKVEVEGIQMSKQDKSKSNVRFNPAFLLITELNLEDKKRNDILNRNKNKVVNKKETGEKNAP